MFKELFNDNNSDPQNFEKIEKKLWLLFGTIVGIQSVIDIYFFVIFNKYNNNNNKLKIILITEGIISGIGEILFLVYILSQYTNKNIKTARDKFLIGMIYYIFIPFILLRFFMYVYFVFHYLAQKHTKEEYNLSESGPGKLTTIEPDDPVEPVKPTPAKPTIP
jgi:hypothetical protein